VRINHVGRGGPSKHLYAPKPPSSCFLPVLNAEGKEIFGNAGTDVTADAMDLGKLDDALTPASPVSPASFDGGNLQQTAMQDHEHGAIDNVSLARTRSIAEQLSLPHEIAFVALVCMSQFFTRKISIPSHSNQSQTHR
jgi:hypothetical protein